VHDFGIFRQFLRFFGFIFGFLYIRGVKKTARYYPGHDWIILKRENRRNLCFSSEERERRKEITIGRNFYLFFMIYFLFFMDFIYNSLSTMEE
jgi:hypothetical protein